MTKKFWKDWQKRVGETKNIWLFSKYYGNAFYGSYVLNNNDKLVKVKFHEDTVDLIIERHKEVLDFNTRSIKQYVENENLTLNRNDIATIYFLRKDVNQTI
jgi:hypothetical protein